MRALRIFIVFTTAEDLELFRAALRCLSPSVPEAAWTPVVIRLPTWRYSFAGPGAQYFAAYKKWYGVAEMMDLGAEGPEYGLMLDAELGIYRPRVGDDAQDWGLVCGADSPWERFFERIRGKEASKSWPAARVSPTLKVYPFTPTQNMTGMTYDRTLINENAKFVTNGQWNSKGEYEITGAISDASRGELDREYRLCLFTWWTDLPWMNLTVAMQMLSSIRSKGQQASWREKITSVKFPRFEIISYHQWCVLHEGFRFDDLTNLTMEARWGSYMEDPLAGSRLGELEPLWVSSQALERSEKGIIGPLSTAVPPLLVFHTDQGHPRKGFRPQREKFKKLWANVTVTLLQQQGRTDYTMKSFR